jgi:hypothetical protein
MKSTKSHNPQNSNKHNLPKKIKKLKIKNKKTKNPTKLKQEKQIKTTTLSFKSSNKSSNFIPNRISIPLDGENNCGSKEYVALGQSPTQIG